MSRHTETHPSSREERIRELEQALQTTRSELSYIGTTLIDEKNRFLKVREYTDTVIQENERLKNRVNELEADATRSGARTQEYSRQQYRAFNSPPMSPVSVPTSPRVHHPHHLQHLQHQQQYPYQCSMAMVMCDGMYFTPFHDTSSPPRLSPETPEPSQQADEYETDPAAYWVKEYPKWERKYNEEMNKLEAEEARETNDY